MLQENILCNGAEMTCMHIKETKEKTKRMWWRVPLKSIVRSLSQIKNNNNVTEIIIVHCLAQYKADCDRKTRKNILSQF